MPSPKLSQSKHRVLIVDDTPSNVQLLVPILLKTGKYELSVADSGEKALNLLNKITPDLILLDVMMPGIDGYETCRRIKERPHLKQVPVIFLTARTEVEDAIQAFGVGAVDYVTKPFNACELVARVDTHVALKDSYDLIAEQFSIIQEQARQLREKVDLIESDLERARIVQHSLLPDHLPQHDHLHIAYRYFPMEQVGGDYLSLPKIDTGRQGFLLGDLTGHGVSAALFMALVKFVSDNLYSDFSRDPRAFIRKMNDQLYGQLPSAFITAVYGYLEAREQGGYDCLLAAASPPKPLLRSAPGGDLEFIKTPSSGAIGLFPRLDAENVHLELLPGSRLYLYTDGAIECCNPGGQELGYDGFKEIVSAADSDDLNESLDEISRRLADYRGDQALADDLTLLAIEVK